MGNIRKTIALWLILVFVIFLDNTFYAINRHFHYTDLILVATVLLVLSDRAVSALVFAAAAGVLHDAFLIPYSGFSVLSGVLAYLMALILSTSLYRENYSTKVVIIGICCLAKEIIQVLIVFVFYSNCRLFIFPFAIVIMKIFWTTLFGAVIAKLLEIDYGKAGKWLKLKTTYTIG